MSLLYTEIEQDLRGSVRAMPADRCPPDGVLARVEGDDPCDLGLWEALGREVGLAGLLIPEPLGGLGASPREAAVVLEELGRSVAPAPFLTSAVLATNVLLGAGTAHADKLLGDLATGASTAALAVSLAASAYRRDEPAIVVQDGRLTGSVRNVPGAEAADLLLVPVSDAVYAVTRFTVEPTVSLDLTRPLATVLLDRAPATPIGGGRQAVASALAATAGLLASEQLGVAEWCLETTVAYVKERKQFARPVGSFQAIKHRLADVWLDLIRARAAARNAATRLSAEPVQAGSALTAAARTSIAVAQAWCGPTAVHAAEECIQMHGGIGMSWEHPAHLYLKRAKACSIALGTAGDHHDSLADLADVPPPP